MSTYTFAGKPQPKNGAADPAPPKEKRPATAAQVAANQANSKRSTGPGLESRARTRFNGVKLGLTGRKFFFLPGESEAEFYDQVASWVIQLGAVTDAEVAQVETAVYALWKADRADRAQVSAATQAAGHVRYDAEKRRAAALQALTATLREDPRAAVAQLMDSTVGCEYLITQYEFIEERLITHDSLEVSQRRELIRLAGYQPGDLFREPVVRNINRSYLGALRGAGGFTAAGAANAFINDRPEDMSEGEFERRFEVFVLDLPSKAQGKWELNAFVKEKIAELRKWAGLIRLREESDLEHELGQAEVNIRPETEKQTRYGATAKREHHAALRELRALQEMRLKYGLGELEEKADPQETTTAEELAPAACDAPAPEMGPVEAPELSGRETVAEPEKVRAHCEANRAEVPVESEVRTASDAAPEVTPDDLAVISPEEDAAIRAHYKTMVDKTVAAVQDE